MKRWVLVLMLVAGPATAQQGDSRLLVEMPPETVAMMTAEMIDIMTALNEIIGHVAAGDLPAAAEIAENRMGLSTMGKHRASGKPPGRYMPDAMRSFAMGMHRSASRFADVAREGDVDRAYQALHDLTVNCAGCHNAFRVR